MHAVLDQLEEPKIVLRQAIREMEEELARQRQRQKWLKVEIESATARIDAFEVQSRDLDSRLDLCFASDNETLARRLTRRKLETARAAEQSAAKRDALARQLEELEGLLESNADQLECMQQKAALFAVDDAGSGDSVAAGIDADDVEIAFLREKQARVKS
jgi:phage shock protein A